MSMTPDEMRVAIASKVNLDAWRGTYGLEFDPLNDLNAMHKAILGTIKTDVLQAEFEYRLRAILAGDRPTFEVSGYELTTATAAQRAEAFCRVMWPERWTE